MLVLWTYHVTIFELSSARGAWIEVEIVGGGLQIWLIGGFGVKVLNYVFALLLPITRDGPMKVDDRWDLWSSSSSDENSDEMDVDW